MAIKDIIVRDLEDDDLAEVSEWFTSRNWNVAPQGKVLPDSGYVAVHNGKLLSVAWLYVTNSEVGIIDWIATNPEEPRLGIISVKKLIRHIEMISEGRIRTFLSFIPNDKFAQYLKRKCGFKITEKDVNICSRTRPMEAAHG